MIDEDAAAARGNARATPAIDTVGRQNGGVGAMSLPPPPPSLAAAGSPGAGPAGSKTRARPEGRLGAVWRGGLVSSCSGAVRYDTEWMEPQGTPQCGTLSTRWLILPSNRPHYLHTVCRLHSVRSAPVSEVDWPRGK